MQWLIRVRSRSHSSFEVTVERVLICVTLLLFFRPPVVERFGVLNEIANIGLLFSMIVAMLLLILRTGIRLDIFTIIAIVYFSYLFIITCINNESIARALMYSGVGIVSVLFFKSLIESELPFFLLAMKILAILLIPLNLITMLFLPSGFAHSGVHPVFLLGQATRFIFFYFPTLLCSALNDYLRCQRLSWETVLLFVLSQVSVVWGGTAAGSILVLLLFACIVFAKSFSFRRLIRPTALLSMQIALFVLITFFRIQNYFAEGALAVLGKDATLSSRTYIWDSALRMINSSLDSLLWGHGVLQNSDMVNLLNFVHCHNHLLQVLFNGGLVGFLLFVTLIVVSYVSMVATKDKLPTSVIAGTLFLFSVALLFDSVDGVRNYYIVLLQMGTLCPCFVKWPKQREGS